jgi:hypothetical protein
MKTVRIVEQLAIFIANTPGTLVDVCDALAEDKINIYGLTVSDTVDHAVVRMVVSDTRRAIALLEAHGTLVLESDVLIVENDNRPGASRALPRRWPSRRSTSSMPIWLRCPWPGADC